VTVELDEPVREYWRRRLVQHNYDSDCGVALAKFPEDLRAYEHLLWRVAPEVVVEVGTHHGGSALWFRDRLRVLAGHGRISRHRVVSIDLDQAVATEKLVAADPRYADDIVLVAADICDASVRQTIDALVPAGSRCLVVEDSAHVAETTTAALENLSHLVPPGGFFVVEDAVVDVEPLRAVEGWPRGVAPAIDAWLATPAGSGFRVRRDLECYGITCHPGGFLERVRP
jgi:cephalosporin hydroxylase